jgi:DMSO/TMAO reductase YedYZ molybdopterin-dependent catalytic subunit
VAAVSKDFPTLDPKDVHRRAVASGLIIRRAHPLNGETAITELVGEITPTRRFYQRNHCGIPKLDAEAFRLAVRGLVERPLSLSLRDLHQLPSRDLMVTLECAGNGRADFEPPIEGEKWQHGAVSTAEWTGVSLATVLDRAGVKPGARAVVFRGADSAAPERGAAAVHFERSLSLETSIDADVILAYAMNGERLPVEHGYPLRLIVPDWYAMASVKWLTEIEVAAEPLQGPFQTEKYCYEWQRADGVVREPVTLQRVRSLITEPVDHELVPGGELAIRGLAWSGVAPITRVEVSVGGAPFQAARLLGEPPRHAWQWWELITRVGESGVVTVRARAFDGAGRTQPNRPEWNRLGYGNNAPHQIAIRVA